MIAALVPAKALSSAKGRLAAVLSPPERRLLSLAMLADVLRALGEVPLLERRAVVSPDAEVLQAAASAGAEAILESPQTRGLNSGLTFARQSLAAAGAGTLLVVPADIPAITAADITAILAALPTQRGAVVVRSAEGGTSALALRPADAIPFRFGPQSALAHQREAERASVPSQLLSIPSIANDIDSPSDLLDILSRPTATDTQRLLLRLEIGERLAARATWA